MTHRLLIGPMIMAFAFLVGMIGASFKFGELRRSELVLDCIRLMADAAPLDVSQADPDYAFESAWRWCDVFVGDGGRYE